MLVASLILTPPVTNLPASSPADLPTARLVRPTSLSPLAAASPAMPSTPAPGVDGALDVENPPLPPPLAFKARSKASCILL